MSRKNKNRKGLTPEEKMNNRRTLKRVLRLLRPQRALICGSIFCAALCVASQLLVPIFCGNAIDLMLGPDHVDFSGLMKIVIRILGLTGVTALAGWVLSTCNNRISFLVSRDLRNEAIAKIQHLPLSYLDTHSEGDLVSRMIADVDTFADGLLMGFTQLFTGVLTIAVTLIFMVSVNPLITLVVVGLTPLSLFVASFISSHTYRYFQQQAAVRGEQTALINEQIEGLRVMQSFGREETSLKEFDEINDRLQEVSLKSVFFSSLTNPSTRLVNNLVYAGVALTGALFVVTGGDRAITIGQLSIFLSYASQYAKPFNEISAVVTEMQNAIACAARVFALLDEPEEEQEKREILEADGHVSLKQVGFRYVPDRPLIENFHLEVEPGQRIAIVGPTGCGKTTLINLLMRFYDVNEGAIRMAGKDIRDVTRHSLRGSFGMVLQETWLKSGTIRENISYGKPDATEEEIIAAAKAAHAHSFIRRLPRGYDTLLSENGANISQGQKQLLCIARVMLSLPSMLILDEATSSIDTRTEIRIQSAFSQMMKGRTSFIVAHRLSTIREADVILVMNAGQIVEQGNHETLMELGGFYANLYNSQFSTQSVSPPPL